MNDQPQEPSQPHPSTNGGKSAGSLSIPTPSLLITAAAANARRAFRKMLEGYQTVESESVAETRQRMEEPETSVQAVLLDLPACDAETTEGFLEWAQAHHPDVSVIVISESRSEKDVIHCLARGASDFLEKPVQADTLRRVVHRALRRRSRRRLGTRRMPTTTIRAMSPAAGWVELTAPSEFDYLSRLERFTNILFGSRLSHEDCEDLRMAMEEIGRNAIEWGNRLDPEKQFSISYCFFNDRVVLKFEDEGEGFHPDTLPDPSQDPAGLVQNRVASGKRPGGFGVFLVHNLMDEVVYSEKGNVVLMTKFFR